MVSVSYSDLHSVMDLTTSTLTAAETEDIIDLAIDTLNLYGNLEISRMSGAAGSKTVTLTSRQRGAVLFVARAIYYSYFKDIQPVQVAGEGIQPMDLLANPTMERMIVRAARMLSTFTVLRTM